MSEYYRPQPDGSPENLRNWTVEELWTLHEHKNAEIAEAIRLTHTIEQLVKEKQGFAEPDQNFVQFQDEHGYDDYAEQGGEDERI